MADKRIQPVTKEQMLLDQFHQEQLAELKQIRKLLERLVQLSDSQRSNNAAEHTDGRRDSSVGRSALAESRKKQNGNGSKM